MIEKKELTILEPAYFHREYSRDLKKTESYLQLAQRVALVVLPFLSLYNPLSYPLSLGLGGMRVITCSMTLYQTLKYGKKEEVPYELIQTMVGVVGVAGAAFSHPVGMFVTTGHDLVSETIDLIKHIKNKDCKKAAACCLKIINNALYFGLFFTKKLELMIVSLSVQILSGLYQAKDELSQGNYIEAAGQLGMCLVRGYQLTGQAKLLQLKWRIEAAKQEAERVAIIQDTEDCQVEKNNKALINRMMGSTHSETEQTTLFDLWEQYSNNPEGIPVLNYATLQNDEHAVSLLLASGQPVDLSSKMGTPLEIALKHDHFSLATFLLENNATPTALCGRLSAEKHLLNFIDLMAKYHPEIQKSNSDVGYAILKSFNDNASLDEVKWFFNKGFNLPKSFDRNRDLYFILNRKNENNLNIAKCLIENGADCSITVKREYYANAEPNFLPPRPGITPDAAGECGLLVPAMSYNDDELIKLLVTKNAKLNSELRQNHFAFELTHRFSYYSDESAEFILSLDPLYRMELSGRFDMADYLISKGAKRNSSMDQFFEQVAARRTWNKPLDDVAFQYIPEWMERGKIGPFFLDEMAIHAIKSKDLDRLAYAYSLGATTKLSYFQTAKVYENPEAMDFLREHS